MPLQPSFPRSIVLRLTNEDVNPKTIKLIIKLFEGNALNFSTSPRNWIDAKEREPIFGEIEVQFYKNGLYHNFEDGFLKVVPENELAYLKIEINAGH